jgi:hypothetical protein
MREGVGGFLRKEYLHWLEALSIRKSISQGIAAMLKLEGLLQVSNSSYRNIPKPSPLLTLERL